MAVYRVWVMGYNMCVRNIVCSMVYCTGVSVCA